MNRMILPYSLNSNTLVGVPKQHAQINYLCTVWMLAGIACCIAGSLTMSESSLSLIMLTKALHRSKKNVEDQVKLTKGMVCPSLVPRPHAPPGEKQCGEQSWAYYPKVVMTNEIVRLVIIM